uniref:Uncharacterized protein n=1 Tax=Aegilops tauschii subsp. strangulata TaxID=200361 RepID=A0A453LYU1_AEGTS
SVTAHLWRYSYVWRGTLWTWYTEFYQQQCWTVQKIAISLLTHCIFFQPTRGRFSRRNAGEMVALQLNCRFMCLVSPMTSDPRPELPLSTR